MKIFKLIPPHLKKTEFEKKNSLTFILGGVGPGSSGSAFKVPDGGGVVETNNHYHSSLSSVILSWELINSIGCYPKVKNAK